jgi:hypothetical protein
VSACYDKSSEARIHVWQVRAADKQGLLHGHAGRCACGTGHVRASVSSRSVRRPTSPNNRQCCSGQANGVHKVWLNGEKIYDDRSVMYRTTPESLIEIFTFRNFHGGKSDRYRPDQTQYTWCGLSFPPSPMQHTAYLVRDVRACTLYGW